MAHKHLWSMMVRMVSNPQLLDRSVIKSIAIWVKGGALPRTVILYRGMHVQCVRFLFC